MLRAKGRKLPRRGYCTSLIAPGLVATSEPRMRDIPFGSRYAREVCHDRTGYYLIEGVTGAMLNGHRKTRRKARRR